MIIEAAQETGSAMQVSERGVQIITGTVLASAAFLLAIVLWDVAESLLSGRVPQPLQLGELAPLAAWSLAVAATVQTAASLFQKQRWAKYLAALAAPPLLGFLTVLAWFATAGWRSGGYAAEQGMAALGFLFGPIAAALTTPYWILFAWWAARYLPRWFPRAVHIGWSRRAVRALAALVMLAAVFSLLRPFESLQAPNSGNGEAVYEDRIRAAIEDGDRSELESLLASGTPVVPASALEIAVRDDNVPLVEYLLGHALITGADGDSRLLHLALRHRSERMLELLLTAPLAVDARDPDTGRTALMEAARLRDEHAVRLLLDRGAHPRLVDAGGRTAAQWAVESGDPQLAELLDSTPEPYRQ